MKIFSVDGNRKPFLSPQLLRGIFFIFTVILILTACEMYDANGFNAAGINRATQRKYDRAGFKKDGYNDAGSYRDDFTMLNTRTNAIYNIWSDGITMYVADRSAVKIYAYKMDDKSRDADKDFDTLSDAGNDSPTGIWSNGTTMWVVDTEDDKIYAYRMSDTLRDPDKDIMLVEDGDPSGLWSNGTTVWVAEPSGDPNILAYDLESRARPPKAE